MKKITPYFSDSYKLNESRNTKRSFRKAVNESAYDDFKELYTDRDLTKVISSAVNNSLTILIGQSRGNQLIPTISDICDDLDLAAVSVSCRSIRENRALIDELYEANDDLVVITDFEIADPRMLSMLASYIEDRDDIGIICVSNNPEDLANNPLFDFAAIYFYVPQYSKMSVVDDDIDESVSQRFAKYRKLYEEDSADISEEDDEDKSDDSKDSDEGSDDSEGSDENQSDDSENSDEGSDDETVDVPMTAVVLTVKKDDADKCKDELIEAGIPEENIEIIEGEDDDEDSQIKVDADSVKELKDYLSGKGIDLEEKIGGEIIDDEEGEEDSEGSDESGEDSGEEGGEDDQLDFDKEFGDLFGDEEASSDEQ